LTCPPWTTMVAHTLAYPAIALFHCIILLHPCSHDVSVRSLWRQLLGVAQCFRFCRIGASSGEELNQSHHGLKVKMFSAQGKTMTAL
jgi:hypothetical protein